MGAHYHNDYTIFRVYAPHAKIVSVVGEFNNWDTTKNVMKKITNEGLYETIIEGIKEHESRLAEQGRTEDAVSK